MGAFFLCHRNSYISKSELYNSYLKKKFINPNYFTLGEYELILFKKQLLKVRNFYSNRNWSIYVCGSLFYKKLGFQSSLIELLNDFSNNILNPNELFGNYIIIFHNNLNDQINFYIDPSFIKNVYFSSSNLVISSDLLAISSCIKRPLTINIDAIVENITTGHLISPDTYFNEIQKLDRANLVELNSVFRGIQFSCFSPNINVLISNRHEAIDHANATLNHYFYSSQNICDEYGAHVGLTGGFDSRLILIHTRNILSKLISNSFWMPESIDYLYAKELALTANIQFFSFENLPFNKPETYTLMERAYNFFDGQIRSQNRWDEEFTLSDYVEKIAQEHYVGFHGCGGEQYRNADRLIDHWSIKSFIMYGWMFKQCPNTFLDKNYQKIIFCNIKRKMERLLNIRLEKVDLILLKRIQNEIWNTSNRTTRVNILNQQQFYFAPFTEYQISQSAYSYIPFLGHSSSFQIDMIKGYDEKLATVKTNYGFSPINGEPFTNRVLPYILLFAPAKLVNKLFFQFRKSRTDDFQNTINTIYENKFFKDLDCKINFRKLINNVNLASGVNSALYFLNTLENKNSK